MSASASTPARPTVWYPNPPVPLYAEGTPPADRKRKYAAIAETVASSPAPSENAHQSADTQLLAANVQASASRPRLTVSRGPVFITTAECPEYFLTDQIAMNRLGFRYIPAGLSEPGSKIPYRTIESRPEGYVRVSWEDRSPFIKVTPDGLGLMGEKGFRSARCNVPVREGKWYMEVRIEHGGGEAILNGATREGPHVRLGWARREAPLNGPVGQDGYSYGYRDKTGDKVTLSRPRPYGRPFGSGDVVGLYVSLPPRKEPCPDDIFDPAHIKRERIAIDFKGQEYWESIEYQQSKEMIALMNDTSKAKASTSLPSTSKKSATVKNLPDRGRNPKSFPEPIPSRPLPSLPASHIAFFVNGDCQGVAYQDLYDYLQLRAAPASRKAQPRRRLREGTREHKENPFDDGSLGYYPFISLFNGARVRLNPGPDFEFPPPPDVDGLLVGDLDSQDTKKRTWRPLSERYAEYMSEQWAQDMQEEDEAKSVAMKQEQEDEAEAKAVARRERKRVTEQKRRARKANERATKQEKGQGEDNQLPVVLPQSATSHKLESDTTGSLSVPVLRRSHSPAPTVASSVVDVEMFGGDSGWNSLDEMDVIAQDGQEAPTVQDDEDEDEDQDLLAAIAG